MLTPPIPARPQPLSNDPLPTRIPTYREASVKWDRLLEPPTEPQVRGGGKLPTNSSEASTPIQRPPPYPNPNISRSLKKAIARTLLEKPSSQHLLNLDMRRYQYHPLSEVDNDQSGSDRDAIIYAAVH